MKSLTRLWQEMAEELAIWCDTCTRRDVETLRRRVEHEGISFMTITLPSFASDFEKSLDAGRIGSDLFKGFSRKGGLPRFLSGFLCQVFDFETGLLQDLPSVDSIFAIRQLTLVFKKIELRCTPDRERAAVDKFVSCEQELKALDSEWTRVSDPEFSRISALVFGDVFNEVNREIDQFEISPQHGPGATADRKKGNAKFVQSEWTERLEAVFPYGEYVLPSWRHYQPKKVKFLPPASERPVKVTLVPKTLKTPRIIAVEPTAMQYMQQGLLQSFVPKLESVIPARYFVGFTEQEPNQLLAREGSVKGHLATLDLSEASDRVLNSAVLQMLKPWPSLSEAVQATRSRTAVLQDGSKIRLSKFASMGSALCFPFEAMVFTTLVLMGIQDARGIQLSRAAIQRLRGSVRVYGDDIIVPVDSVPYVIRRLESYGLKVNADKSFWTGKFRESCGADFYDGEDVKPIRLTQKPPVTRRNVSELIAWTAFSNSLYWRGLWKTADFVKRYVEEILGELPCVPHSAQGVLGLHSSTGVIPNGWSKHLQAPLIKVWKTQSLKPRNSVEDIWALRKCLASDWSDPVYADHLERSGRPLAVHIKRGWVSAS